MVLNYIIITPAFNEEENIEKTILSVTRQTILPSTWIIYDDHSDDRTASIVLKHQRIHPWIQLVKGVKLDIEDKGERIATIVNMCANNIQSDFEYLVKLDADTSFNEDFFYNILNEFENRKKLGIASGRLMYNGIKEQVRHMEHTRGATKVYRRECWFNIGGLYKTTGWDSIDDICAMYYGWETQTLNFYFEHHKEEGAHLGYYKMNLQEGLFCGKIPYSFPYFFLKILSNFSKKPFILSSAIQALGYIKMRIIYRERILPNEISKYYRKKQNERLYKVIKNALL